MAFTVKYWMVAAELEQMSRYLDIVQSMLDEHKQKLSDSLDEIAKDMTEEEKGEFYEYNSDEYWELADEFPGQLYSSFVVAWYSFIESQLNKLCERRNFVITISIHDRDNIAREGIYRAEKFLKIAGEYSIDKSHWDELTKIGNVRNRIVHGSTRFRHSFNPPSDPNQAVQIVEDGETYYVRVEKNLYTHLQKHGIFKFSSSFHINPTFSYCKHLISFGDAMLSKIYGDFDLK